MNRRAFLATTAAAAAAATMKAASAETVTPFGQTGVPLRATPPLPLGPLPGSVYPDPHLESMVKPTEPTFGPADFPAFAGTMAVERIATGFRWAEGPVYFPAARYVLFSDIPNNRIMSLDENDDHLSVFRQPSMNSNGNTIDREGRLITCEHSGRRVTRTELDGSITIIADKYNGKKLNSPNDAVVAADGRAGRRFRTRPAPSAGHRPRPPASHGGRPAGSWLRPGAPAGCPWWPRSAARSAQPDLTARCDTIR
jgi:gluconolactonase